MNDILMIPYYQLFLLFEPILITETLTKYRSLYPQAAKSGSYAAYAGVALDIGGDAQYGIKDTVQLKYASPYNDIPLEGKMKEKDRERYCPNFDKDINSTDKNTHHAICTAIYKNLLFFFSPKIGGRSHYYTLNFVMGCIAC